MQTQKEESEAMYTGTLIEDLIAAVERAEAQAGWSHSSKPHGAISSVPSARSRSQFVSLQLKTPHWPLPTCGQCHLAQWISLGTVVRLRSRFNNLQLPPSW
jgi:hypothetical protein